MYILIANAHQGIKRFERLLENSARKGRFSKVASVIRHSINDNDMFDILEIQRLKADILSELLTSPLKLLISLK